MRVKRNDRTDSDLEQRKHASARREMAASKLAIAAYSLAIVAYLLALLTHVALKVVAFFLLALAIIVAAWLGVRKLPSTLVTDDNQPATHGQRKMVLAARWVLLLSSVTFVTLLLASLVPGIYRSATSSLKRNTIILVADFIGPEARFRVTDFLIQSLHDAENEYGDVKVQPLGDSISEVMGSDFARARGEQKNGSVVLWGWYVTTADRVRVTIHVEVLNEPLLVADMRKSEETYESPDFGGFEVQLDLASRARFIALLTSGLVHYRKQDFGGAITRFSVALSERAIPSEIIDPAPVHFYRAVCYLMRGEFDNAIADYDSALARSPRGVAYIGRGVAYANRGLLDRAIADFDSAIARNAALESAYSNRAEAFLEKGLPEQAIADLDSIIAHHPDDVRAHVERGRAYSQAGNLDRAISDLDWSIRAREDPSAYFYRGRVYAKKGLDDRAIADYDKAIILGPWNLSALVNRANAYARSGQYARALTDYDSAIARDRSYGSAYLNRTETYLVMNRADLAVSDFYSAIVYGEGQPYGYWGRAKSYAALGLPEREVEDLTAVISLRPDRTDAYYARGVALATLDRISEARQDFNVVLRQASDPAMREGAKRMLRTLGQH